MKKGLKTQLMFIALKVFDTINYRCLINNYLKSHCLSNHRQNLGIQSHSNPQYGLGYQSATTTSSFFTDIFHISDEILLLSNKAIDIGYTLWHRYHCYIKINGLTSEACSLYKYTWKVITYIV